jgi:hypothetical protein
MRGGGSGRKLNMSRSSRRRQSRLQRQKTRAARGAADRRRWRLPRRHRSPRDRGGRGAMIAARVRFNYDGGRGVWVLEWVGI